MQRLRARYARARSVLRTSHTPPPSLSRPRKLIKAGSLRALFLPLLAYRAPGRAPARGFRPCCAALSAPFACSLRPRLRGAGALRFASLPPPRAAAGVRVRLLSAALCCSLRAPFPSPCARPGALSARSRERPSQP